MYYSILQLYKTKWIDFLSQTVIIQKPSKFQDLRFHFMAHEVFWGLTITAFNLLIAWIFPEVLHYHIFIELVIASVVIHPGMIGFDTKAFDIAFPSTVVRGLLLGFCYGFLQYDLQLSILQTMNLFLPLMASIFFSLGFFSEFMRRRGFSDWINSICTSIIMCLFVFFLLSELPSLLYGILLFSSIALAASIRLQTKNVWDGILVLLFLYIITSQAEVLFHLFATVR